MPLDPSVSRIPFLGPYMAVREMNRAQGDRQATLAHKFMQDQLMARRLEQSLQNQQGTQDLRWAGLGQRMGAQEDLNRSREDAFGQRERFQEENTRRLWQGMSDMERHRGVTEEQGRQGLDLKLRALEQRISQGDRPPPKPGYAYDPREPQRQVPISGGPAWRDLSSKHATDMQSVLSLQTQAEGAMDKVDRILDPKRKGAFNSNFGGYNAAVTQFLPGDSQNMRKEIESFKSEMKAAGLNMLRAGGGSIGAITQAEWPIIEQTIDSISPLLGEKEAREAFQRVKVRMQRMLNNTHRVYDTEWGDSPFYKRDLKTKVGSQELSPAEQQELDQLRRRFGR